MEKRSVGLIETWGITPAIEAADAATKAANVVLLGYDNVEAGLITVFLAGDVAAVKAAVSAGATAARTVGKVVSTHVIPRPDRRLPMRPSGPQRPVLKNAGPPPVPPTPPVPESQQPKAAPGSAATAEEEQPELPEPSETADQEQAETPEKPATAPRKKPAAPKKMRVKKKENKKS